MKKVFAYQQFHFLILMVLLFLLSTFVKSDPGFTKGVLWNVSSLNWFVLAILVPILHQVYVLLVWRLELYFKSISNFFGPKGFKLYKVGFVIFMLLRIITIVCLAISNANTLTFHPAFSYLISILLLIPVGYLFYSLVKYFGIDRAIGKDHFYPEIAKNEPFVNQGIFKYTANGMYKYGVLILWIPGILLQSKAAISVAFFSHIYIWVHYYFTELPDIRMIYK